VRSHGPAGAPARGRLEEIYAEHSALAARRRRAASGLPLGWLERARAAARAHSRDLAAPSPPRARSGHPRRAEVRHALRSRDRRAGGRLPPCWARLGPWNGPARPRGAQPHRTVGKRRVRSCRAGRAAAHRIRGPGTRGWARGVRLGARAGRSDERRGRPGGRRLRDQSPFWRWGWCSGPQLIETSAASTGHDPTRGSFQHLATPRGTCCSCSPSRMGTGALVREQDGGTLRFLDGCR
jgi:hypothetical protein